jgi:hypothetical protein
MSCSKPERAVETTLDPFFVELGVICEVWEGTEPLRRCPLVGKVHDEVLKALRAHGDWADLRWLRAAVPEAWVREFCYVVPLPGRDPAPYYRRFADEVLAEAVRGALSRAWVKARARGEVAEVRVTRPGASLTLRDASPSPPPALSGPCDDPPGRNLSRLTREVRALEAVLERIGPNLEWHLAHGKWRRPTRLLGCVTYRDVDRACATGCYALPWEGRGGQYLGKEALRDLVIARLCDAGRCRERWRGDRQQVRHARRPSVRAPGEAKGA